MIVSLYALILLLTVRNWLTDIMQELLRGDRHEALYTLDVYPVVKGVSHFHGILTADDVVRIQKNVTEEIYGDFVVTVDTNHIEQDFNKVLDEVKKFINTTGGSVL